MNVHVPVILLGVRPQEELQFLVGLNVRVEGMDPRWHAQRGDQALFAGELPYLAVTKKGPSQFLHVQGLKVWLHLAPLSVMSHSCAHIARPAAQPVCIACVADASNACCPLALVADASNA